MTPVVAIIAPGAMGSAVGKRLTENGVEVRTSLAGRSAESSARAKAAGMMAASDEEIVAADFLLSIVPPGEALALVGRLSPALTASNRKPVYVECNAVNPRTMDKIAPAVAATGAPLVDAGIIGPPPKPGSRTIFYASGPEAPRFATLGQYGLDIRAMDDTVGNASAMKMSYAGITKGFQALGAAMILAATRAGTAEALHRELTESQPALLGFLSRQLPGMYPKAYRWIAEMEEIAGFVGEDEAARAIFDGTTALYERIVDDFEGDNAETEALTNFVKRGGAS